MRKHNSHIHIPEDPERKPSLIAIGILLIVAPPVTTLIGLVLGYKRLRAEYFRKRYQLYRRYANTIGERDTVSIREIAASMGVSNANALEDIQSMIDQGFMGEDAHIDRSHMTLYLGSDIVDTTFASPVINVYVSPEDRERTAAEARAKQAARDGAEKAAEKAKQAKEASRPAREPRRSTGIEVDDFEAKLREIRQVNEDIADPGVSRRIDRIGELTASIFRVVQEKPEHAEEVRKFMNYYLPTTLKLLKSYSLMEKQSYQGENIQSSRKKIEDVLDTLVHAFEQQQDRLFRTEAMDVDADISVLETMMASDGLVEPEGGGLRLGGH